MKVHITARHIKLTDSLANYVNKKLKRLERHFDHLVWASVILSVEKHRHMAEIVIHSPLHTMRSKAESKDLYSAIDLSADKADKQLRRLKEKWKDIHRAERRRAERETLTAYGGVPAGLVMPPAVDGDGGRDASLPAMVSVVKQVPVQPMNVAEAIQTMESLGYNFWLFLNKTTKQLNVIFRRFDQTYGLMEPKK